VPLTTRRYQPWNYAEIRPSLIRLQIPAECASGLQPIRSSASRDRGSHNSSRSPYASSFASHSSGPSNTPRGSSLFASSASRGRSSQDSSQSPYASPYASRSSGYGAPSNTPRGSSLFASSAPESRGSQHSSLSPYTSSSPSSAGSYTSYNSAKSHLTDYKPRGGWFPSFGYR
jgi:hypothetical protein